MFTLFIYSFSYYLLFYGTKRPVTSVSCGFLAHIKALGNSMLSQLVFPNPFLLLSAEVLEICLIGIARCN